MSMVFHDDDVMPDFYGDEYYTKPSYENDNLLSLRREIDALKDENNKLKKKLEEKNIFLDKVATLLEERNK